MILHKRNAYTIYNDDTAFTFIKPLSADHEGELIMLFEDAYGDMNTKYLRIEEIKYDSKYGFTNAEFNKLLILLNEAHDNTR
jgi:hypothetical protein